MLRFTGSVSTYEGYFKLRNLATLSTPLRLKQLIEKPSIKEIKSLIKETLKNNLREYWFFIWYWLSLFFSFIYFTVFDPSLPLIHWILILYSLSSALIIGVFVYSFISHMWSILHVIVKTSNGEQREGFLISSDNNFCLIKTRKGDLLIPTSQILEIVPSEPSAEQAESNST